MYIFWSHLPHKRTDKDIVELKRLQMNLTVTRSVNVRSFLYLIFRAPYRVQNRDNLYFRETYIVHSYSTRTQHTEGDVADWRILMYNSLYFDFDYIEVIAGNRQRSTAAGHIVIDFLFAYFDYQHQHFEILITRLCWSYYVAFVYTRLCSKFQQ